MEKVFSPQNNRLSLITLVLTGWFFLTTPFSVRAADPQLKLTPPFTEVVLDAANPEASFDIEVSNSGTAYEIFGVSVIDFGSLDQTGGVAFLGTRGSDYEMKYGLASWVVVDKNFLQVPPGGSDKIKITVVNKDSLSPGGHYAAVLLSSDATVGNQLGNVSFNYAFSSLIFAKKLGGEIIRLELNRIRQLPSLLLFPDNLDLSFQNSGNIHLVPRGEIIITDPVGRQVGRGIINPESGIILPESFRNFKTTIRASGLALLPGPYSIRINYRFDGREEFTVASASYIYIGLPFAVSFLLSLLLPFLYFRFFRRHRVTKSHAKKTA